MSRLVIRNCLLLFFIAWCFSATSVNAQTDTSAQAVGVHGMAVFRVDDTFYASHMPLTNSIHAHQVIFSFSVENGLSDQLEKLLSEQKLVSLMPEVFDLHELMSGELNEFKGNVHANHFERGGKVAMQDMLINVNQLLLIEPLVETENGEFYKIPLGPTKALLVHKIGTHPSFDQILEIEFSDDPNSSNTTQVLKVTSGSPVEIDQLDLSGQNFSVLKQLYLETRDFQ
ncbi:MAG: hypothetical protein AAF431_14695 [Pseudomonadota bacterium]